MRPLEEIIRECSGPMDPLPTETDARLVKLDGMRAVLFDVYGTLFISGSGDVGTAAAVDRADALAQAMAASGYRGNLEQAGSVGTDLLRAEITEWHAASQVAGITCPEVDIVKVWKKVVSRLRKQGILAPSEIDIEPTRQLALEYECRVNPVWPMPGCLEVIQELKERGLTLGIVSNAQFYTPLLFSAFFEMPLEDIGFDPDCCIWSYRELKGKPSDDLFPRAEKYLKRNHGIKLTETVYVGNDMLNDIYTAGRAGCRTVLFAGDRRSLRMRRDDERCANVNPDAVITELEQLIGLLERPL